MLTNWISRSCHAATSSFLFSADSPFEVNLITSWAKKSTFYLISCEREESTVRKRKQIEPIYIGAAKPLMRDLVTAVIQHTSKWRALC